MALYPPGDTRNYAIGGSTLSFEGEDLGNIVSAVVSPEVDDVSFYNAELGYEAPDLFYGDEDQRVVEAARLVIDLTLDELTTHAYNLFFGGANFLDTAIVVFKRRVIAGAVVITGESETGPKYSWDPPKCHLKASGGLSYRTQDWISIPLELVVYPTSDAPDAPFGTFTVVDPEAS